MSNPGTYTVTEGATPSFIDGKDKAGTAGGIANGDSIRNIALIAGTDATGYDFAELRPGSLSGFVYFDINHNGAMDSDDFGIFNVTVTLSGTNDLGQAVDITTATNEDGAFAFRGLRPGTYEIVRSHPAIFIDYKNNVGSLGGTVGKDAFTNIALPTCAHGVNYNFGELQGSKCNLRKIAVSVGNMYARYQRKYQAAPGAMAKSHPNLVPFLASGRVPFGVPPFPKAALATRWVPKLGTKVVQLGSSKGHR